jgi:mono/diheme cytochrome c family protein
MAPANFGGAAACLSGQGISVGVARPSQSGPSYGQRPMPPIAENLDPVDRWDVINYIRSLER